MATKDNTPRSESDRPKLNQAKPGVRFPDEGAKTAARPRPAGPVSTAVKPRRTAPPPPPANNTLMIIVGGMLLLAAVIFITVIVTGGSNKTDPTPDTAATIAGAASPSAGDVPIAADPTAQVETFAYQGQHHLTTGETVQSVLGQPYNSNPPTSGPHLGYASPWGIFAQPIQDELQVHNLEHGGVVIQYFCPQGCVGTANALAAYGGRYPATNFTGILLAPRASLPEGSRIALTAWTHRLLLKSLDTAKIDQFIKAYIGKGPEQDPSFRP